MRLDDAGEFVFQPAIKVSELLVVQAHEVEDGRVQIPKVTPIHRRALAQLIRLTEARAGFYACARHPIREALGIMISSTGLAAGVEGF